jgi:catechol O-methyltransferase
MTNRLTYLFSLLKAGTRKGETDDAVKDRLVKHVLDSAPKDDVQAALDVIDDFGSKTSFLMNIGDVKGLLLDDVVGRVKPVKAVELGSFCGYSGLRIARALPADGKLFSIEISPKNADVSTKVWEHAGVADRVTAVVGTIDDGKTIGRLKTEFGMAPGSLDFLFIDHEHTRYLPDLLLLLESDLFHEGSVVFADNVKFPGAPKYLAYMRDNEGRSWRTVEHKSHLEYQKMIPDLVLESTYLGSANHSE